MNCRCNPPKPAVIRRVGKSGPNFDKEFFACELGTNGCGFFQWADATMPPPPTRNFAKNSNAKGRGENVSADRRGVRARIIISSIQFDGRPPMKIMLRLISPYYSQITNFLESIPKDLCSYDNYAKLWTFSFDVYDRIVAYFETEEVRNLQLELEALPRFLVVGLRNYLKRINILPDTSNTELNITPSLYQMLLPFQIDGIRFVVARGGRSLIGDEMGKI